MDKDALNVNECNSKPTINTNNSSQVRELLMFNLGAMLASMSLKDEDNFINILSCTKTVTNNMNTNPKDVKVTPEYFVNLLKQEIQKSGETLAKKYEGYRLVDNEDEGLPVKLEVEINACFKEIKFKVNCTSYDGSVSIWLYDRNQIVFEQQMKLYPQVDNEMAFTHYAHYPTDFSSTNIYKLCMNIDSVDKQQEHFLFFKGTPARQSADIRGAGAKASYLCINHESKTYSMTDITNNEQSREVLTAITTVMH